MSRIESSSEQARKLKALGKPGRAGSPLVGSRDPGTRSFLASVPTEGILTMMPNGGAFAFEEGETSGGRRVPR